MRYEKTNDGELLTVALEGEVDSTNVGELEKVLGEQLGGVSTLVMDCEKLEYISSAGLRIFLSMQKKMRERGTMEIRHVNDEVLEIFAVTGLQKLLNIIYD